MSYGTMRGNERREEDRMPVGYARVSHMNKTYISNWMRLGSMDMRKFSLKDKRRIFKGLEECLDYLRAGDNLVVFPSRRL